MIVAVPPLHRLPLVLFATIVGGRVILPVTVVHPLATVLGEAVIATDGLAVLLLTCVMFMMMYPGVALMTNCLVLVFVTLLWPCTAMREAVSQLRFVVTHVTDWWTVEQLVVVPPPYL